MTAAAAQATAALEASNRRARIIEEKLSRKEAEIRLLRGDHSKKSLEETFKKEKLYHMLLILIFKLKAI